MGRTALHPRLHAAGSGAPVTPHSRGPERGSDRRLRVRARDVLEIVLAIILNFCSLLATAIHFYGFTVLNKRRKDSFATRNKF
jgi:hypothetical protein